MLASRLALYPPVRALLVLLTFVACYTLACSGPPRQDGPPPRALSAEEQIFAQVESMARDLESSSTLSFIDRVSDRFQPSRMLFKSDIDEGFNTWSDYRFELERERAFVEGNRGTAVVRWRRQRTRRADGYRELLTGRTDLQFLEENGTWKLTQQVGDTLFGK